MATTLTFSSLPFPAIIGDLNLPRLEIMGTPADVLVGTLLPNGGQNFDRNSSNPTER
jgi:hypothetical protein